ncbi:MAG: hypothetical protein P1P82_14300 [Bacteroidales bacterium]|nr:hypothetical protein [Bacteroidales bacterium]MDT8432212.1 hypothetical protein [Bacteroidales bacterium]
MFTKHEEFGTANINGLLLKLSMPSMLALFANALYNIIDTIDPSLCMGLWQICWVPLSPWALCLLPSGSTG